MRILVVEDEPRLVRSLSKALREEGYAVDTAESGDDGLYKAESWDYDLVVLDIMLPGMDGWEVLERLRKQKKTPVLMLTARDAAPDRVRGLDAGADDYLVKPFDLTELLARVRALIRRSAGVAQPPRPAPVGTIYGLYGAAAAVALMLFILAAAATTPTARRRGGLIPAARRADHDVTFDPAAGDTDPGLGPVRPPGEAAAEPGSVSDPGTMPDVRIR